MDEVVLQSSLNTLVTAELLQKRDHIPQARYQFRHALIQEAAYQSLLKGKRQQYHKQIAGVLEEQFLEIAEAQPELLAHHLTEANLREKAISYWQKAGQRAVDRSAYLESITHLTNGLELLQTLPGPPERIQQELQLRATLGLALIATKGFGAPEVKIAYDRARELCSQQGETPQLFPILRGLAAFYSARAEHQTTYELAEQCLSLAKRQQDPVLLIGAHFELGATLFYKGDFSQSLDHFEQGLSLYNPKEHRSHLFAYGYDLGVACLSRMASVLWFLGYPDRAQKKSQEALLLAQKQAHPFSQAYALSFAAECYRLRREADKTEEKTADSITLSQEHGFPTWLTAARMLQSWTWSEQGRGKEGITQIGQSLEMWQATGSQVALPFWLSIFAELSGKVGRTKEGLQILSEALAIANKNGEHWWDAELYRLKGEFLLGQIRVGLMTKKDQEEILVAEECFQNAFQIAQDQRAKSLELRAAVSLSKLWQTQNKRDKARKLLVEVYPWFTEGFGTADLREAKALLETLSEN